MIEQTVTELASGSIGVAAQLYNAFETPITLILSVLCVGLLLSFILKTFVKQ